MRLNRVAAVAAFGVLLLVASAGVAAAQGTKADAEIGDAEGNIVGSAQITEDSGSIEITVEAEGLDPGEHGVHVHETGECGLPKFESAGKHFNPGETKHGLKNWEGPHAGDLPTSRGTRTGPLRTKQPPTA